MLVEKITRASYAPLPSCVSKRLSDLISQMLRRNPSERPNIKQLLLNPVVQERINAMTEALDSRSFGEAIRPSSAPKHDRCRRSEECKSDDEQSVNEGTSEEDNSSEAFSADEEPEQKRYDEHRQQKLVQRVMQEKERRRMQRQREKEREERLRRVRHQNSKQHEKERELARKEYQRWLEREREKERQIEDAALRRMDDAQSAKQNAYAQREAQNKHEEERMQRAVQESIKENQQRKQYGSPAAAQYRNDTYQDPSSHQHGVYEHQRQREVYQERAGYDDYHRRRSSSEGGEHEERASYGGNVANVRAQAEQRRQQRDLEAMDRARQAFFENRKAAEDIKAKVDAQLGRPHASVEREWDQPHESFHSPHGYASPHTPNSFYDDDQHNPAVERVKAQRAKRLQEQREAEQERIRRAHMQAARDRAALKEKMKERYGSSEVPASPTGFWSPEERSLCEDNSADDGQSSVAADSGIEEASNTEVEERRQALKAIMDGEDESTPMVSSSPENQDNIEPKEDEATKENKRKDHTAVVSNAADTKPASGRPAKMSETPSPSASVSEEDESIGKVVAKAKGGEAIVIDWGSPSQSQEHVECASSNDSMGPLQRAALNHKKSLRKQRPSAKKTNLGSRAKQKAIQQDPPTYPVELSGNGKRRKAKAEDIAENASPGKPPLPPSESKKSVKPARGSKKQESNVERKRKHTDKASKEYLPEHSQGSDEVDNIDATTNGTTDPVSSTPADPTSALYGSPCGFSSGSSTASIAAAISKAQEAAGNVKKIQERKSTYNSRPTKHTNQNSKSGEPSDKEGLNSSDDKVVSLEVEAAGMRDELAEILRMARAAAAQAKGGLESNEKRNVESKREEEQEDLSLSYTLDFESGSDAEDSIDFRPLPEALEAAESLDSKHAPREKASKDAVHRLRSYLQEYVGKDEFTFAYKKVRSCRKRGEDDNTQLDAMCEILPPLAAKQFFPLMQRLLQHEEELERGKDKQYPK